MALPMAHVPPSSLTTRPNGVRDADATSAPRRPLAITDASRRTATTTTPGHHEDVNTEFGGLPHVRRCGGEVSDAPRHMQRHRCPGAREDVYTEFGGLPHVCSGVVVGWGDNGGAETERGEPDRLTAAAHRRAEFLRPSPSVPVRGLRCGGACGKRGGGVDWGEREG